MRVATVEMNTVQPIFDGQRKVVVKHQTRVELRGNVCQKALYLVLA
jgi:hypothetical protein